MASLTVNSTSTPLCILHALRSGVVPFNDSNTSLRSQSAKILMLSLLVEYFVVFHDHGRVVLVEHLVLLRHLAFLHRLRRCH